MVKKKDNGKVSKNSNGMVWKNNRTGWFERITKYTYLCKRMMQNFVLLTLQSPFNLIYFVLF